MTTITINRATVEQALEALECVDLQWLVPDYGSGHYSVDRLDGTKLKFAITALRAALAQQAEPERHFCERCGKRLSQDGIHTCTPPQQIEQAMLGVWQDVPGAVNFGITGDNNG